MSIFTIEGVPGVYGIRLDDVAHRAFLINADGSEREVPRSTTALQDAGVIEIGPWMTEDTRARGTGVHAFVGDFHQPDIVCRDIPKQWEAYTDGYVKFILETRFKALKVEEPIADWMHGYAGRLDLFGILPDLPDGTYDLIDVKTGSCPDYVGFQTMGYRRRVLMNGVQIPLRVRRWALELPGNGNYRLIPLNMLEKSTRIDMMADRRDEGVFLAAVKISRWKRGL